MSARAPWATVAVADPVVDYADVKSGEVELWVIRTPPGFDASRLHGANISIGEAASSSSSGVATAAAPAPDGGSDGFVIRPTPQCESEGLVCAFPSGKKQRYVLGKSFARQFAVSEQIGAATAAVADASAAPPPPLPPVPQIAGLRLRHMFMGGATVVPPTGGSSGGGNGSHKRSSSIADAATEEEAAAKKARKAARKAAKKAAAVTS